MKKLYHKPLALTLRLDFEQPLLTNSQVSVTSNEVKGIDPTTDTEIGTQFSNEATWTDNDEAWGE